MHEEMTEGICLCGSIRWRFKGAIPDATICNCTACRRYGVLWAYGIEDEGITVDDPEGRLTRFGRGDSLTFDFCLRCGNLVGWRSIEPEPDGRRRVAVNLRLAEPEAVAGIPLRRFDGLHSFEDLPRDGRSVVNVWF